MWHPQKGEVSGRRGRRLDRAGHRALTEHILLGGAPRGLAIANATLAGAVGLGLRLWIAGIVFFALGHMIAVWAARRDPQFVDVARRHLRFPNYLQV